jgi:thioredoxin 1
MVINQTKNLNSENIEDFIQEDGIVYVSASFCGPCKTLGPIMDDIAREIHPKIQVGKFIADESDENNEWVKSMGIRSVPTLLFYQFGNIIHRVSGSKSQSELLDLIKEKYGV